MADVNVRLVLKAQADGTYRAVIEGAKQDQRELGNAGAQAGDRVAEGARRGAAGIDACSQELERAKGLVLQYAALAAGAFAVPELARMSDEYTNLSSRIAMVSASEEEALAVREQVFELAQRTRQSLSATGDLYVGITRATEALGLSEAERLRIVERINQAMIVGGQGAAAQEGAIRQLTQALEGGALRGDEYNSVNEQAGALMQVLADRLRVTRGELREMAADGQLTTDVIAGILATSDELDLDRQFGQMSETIGGLLTQLGNVALRWAGTSEEIGAGALAIRGALQLLIENFELVADAVVLVAGLWAVRLVAAGVAAVGAMVGVRLAAAEAATAMGITAAASSGWLATLGRFAVGGPIGLAIAGVAALSAGLYAAVDAFGAAAGEYDQFVDGIEARQLDRLELKIDLALGNDVAFEQIDAGLKQARTDATAVMAEIDRMKQELADARDTWWKTAEVWDGINAKQRQLNELQAIYNQLIGDAVQLSGEAAAAKEREANAARISAVTAGLTDEVRQQTEAFERQAATVGASQTQIVQYELAQAKAAAQTKIGRELMDDERAALEALYAPLLNAARGLDQVRARQEAQTKASREGLKAEQELRRVVADGVGVWERYRAELDPLADLAAKHAKEIDQTAKAMEAGKLTAEQLRLVLRGQAEEYGRLTQEVEEQTRAQTELKAVKESGIDRVLRDLQREIDLLQARNAGDWEAIRALEIQEQIRQRLAQLSEQERAELAANPERRADFEGAVTKAYDLQNQFVFDFGDALGRALQTAFREGSFGAGVQSFLREWRRGLEGGLESALRTIGSTLDFAVPIVDAFRNSNGNEVGSALRALNQQVAQLPGIAGAVGQTLAAIDSLFGGRLFGTDWQASSQGLNVRLGAGGFSGDQFVNEERQRSLFRGTARRTVSSDLDQGLADQLDAFFDGLIDIMASGARALETEVPTLVTGAYRQVADANGRVIEQYSEVLGRRFEESMQAFQQRLTAVNLLAVLDQVFRIPGAAAPPGSGNPVDPNDPARPDPIDGRIKTAEQMMGEASAIAERWIEDAALYLDGAQMLLAAATDIRAGVGLLAGEGGLTAIADLIGDLRWPGESLVETYTRVAVAARLLDIATGLMGVSLEGGREAFVRAAADITEAAGSLDRATQLWNTYFETFYSDSERAALALEQAEATRNERLAAIGLDADISAEAFRAAFEEAFPNLSAEERVQWLEAGESIRNATDAQTAYNEAVEAGAAEMVAALEAQAQALADYAAASQALQDELADVRGMTEYQRTMRDVARWEAERVGTLQDLARAAGMAGAAEADLVAVEEIAAARREAAMRRLEARGRDVVGELFGTGLDQIEQQLAALEQSAGGFTGALTGGLASAQDGSQRLYESMLAGQQRIRDYLDSMLLGPLGGLRPRDALAEGQAQFEALVQAALGGDAEAANALPQLADTILRLGQQTYASGDAYFDLRDWVRDMLGQVANAPVLEPTPGTGTPGGGGGGGFDAGAAEQYSVLQGERERLLAEQEAARRRELALELAGIVRDMMSVPNASLADIEARLGFVSADLVAAMGVSLENLTSVTAGQLADIAQSMGVDLTALAGRLDVELGALADRQSLLNDALEAELQGLPTAQRDALTELLRDVEDAAALGDNAALEAAQGRLVEGVNGLPAHLRDALAPFFEEVEPVQYTELSALATIDGSTAATAANTAAILAALQAANGAQGVPGYEVGTGYVPNTGLALLHEGEAVLPRTVAEWFRREGIPVARVPVPLATGAGDTAALVSEIRELRRERREADAEMQRLQARIAALETAMQDSSRRTERAIDRQTDAIRGARA